MSVKYTASIALNVNAACVSPNLRPNANPTLVMAKYVERTGSVALTNVWYHLYAPGQHSENTLSRRSFRDAILFSLFAIGSRVCLDIDIAQLGSLFGKRARNCLFLSSQSWFSWGSWGCGGPPKASNNIPKTFKSGPKAPKSEPRSPTGA
jgi:hypothetical protein